MDPSVVLHGLVAGCLYALAGISLNILYRPTNTFNFAQGDLIMIGAMFCAALLGVSHLPWYLAALLTIALVAVLSLAEYFVAIAPMIRRRHGVGWIISTLSVSLILQDAVGKLFGPDPRMVRPPPPITTELHQVGPLEISGYQVLVLVFTGLIVALTGWFYTRRTGRAVNAIAEDREAALLRGIDPNRLAWLSFVVGGISAGVIGILAAPMLYASIGLGPLLLIKGFEAVAVGGVGSIRGALIAGCVLGVVEAISGALFTPGYQNAATFVVVLTILLLRPSGLIGTTTTRVV
jgi:branched-chain amino acid transport system permease protein